MKKATIELSMTFIVTFVLSIIILIFGITFIYQMYHGTEKMPDQLSKNIEEELSSIVIGNRLCAVAFPNADVNAGKLKVFGFGILNTLYSDTTFSITATVTKYVSKTGAETTNPAINLLVPEPNIEVPNNERKFAMIGFKSEKTTPRGTYFIDVSVSKGGGGQYCPVQKIVVNVV